VTTLLVAGAAVVLVAGLLFALLRRRQTFRHAGAAPSWSVTADHPAAHGAEFVLAPAARSATGAEPSAAADDSAPGVFGEARADGGMLEPVPVRDDDVAGAIDPGWDNDDDDGVIDPGWEDEDEVLSPAWDDEDDVPQPAWDEDEPVDDPEPADRSSIRRR
jgi:hypothetical protein